MYRARAAEQGCPLLHGQDAAGGGAEHRLLGNLGTKEMAMGTGVWVLILVTATAFAQMGGNRVIRFNTDTRSSTVSSIDKAMCVKLALRSASASRCWLAFPLPSFSY